MNEDPLRPARGCALGLLVGTFLWVAICVVLAVLAVMLAGAGLSKWNECGSSAARHVGHAHMHRIVVPKVAGSSPVGHPTSPRGDPAPRRTGTHSGEANECRSSDRTSAE